MLNLSYKFVHYEIGICTIKIIHIISFLPQSGGVAIGVMIGSMPKRIEKLLAKRFIPEPKINKIKRKHNDLIEPTVRILSLSKYVFKLVRQQFNLTVFQAAQSAPMVFHFLDLDVCSGIGIFLQYIFYERTLNSFLVYILTFS